MSRTYHKNNRPPFVVDSQSIIRTLGRQVNFAKTGDQFKYNAVKVVVGVAGAAADAVAVPVLPLSGPLPNGTLLSFGGKKFARLTAPAVAGATSLTVAAIPTALVSTDTTYAGGSGAKRIPAGTVIVQDTDGQVYPRVNKTASETAYGILETDASEDSKTDALTGYSVIRGGSLWENQLPDAAGGPPKTLPSDYKTEMATNGAQFMFDTYYDSRG